MVSQSFEMLKTDILVATGAGSENGSGFHSIYCPICKENSRKTAGIKIEPDKIVVHCFKASCDSSCVYEIGNPVSKKFRNFCETINVSIPVDLRAVKSSFHKKMEAALDDDLYKKNFYSEMKIPRNFIPYESVSSSAISFWEDYMGSRHCSMDDTFYIDSGMYKGKLALGCYFFDKLIGFQIINHTGAVKYINETDNKNIIYVNERKIRNKVIVVEGALDAKCFPNAVAILSHRMTPEKAFHLRGRDVIMLPDRSGGERFIQTAHEYGWKVCIPSWDEKDLNAAVCRFGVIECAKRINETTLSHSQKDSIGVRFKLWQNG